MRAFCCSPCIRSSRSPTASACVTNVALQAGGRWFESVTAHGLVDRHVTTCAPRSSRDGQEMPNRPSAPTCQRDNEPNGWFREPPIAGADAAQRVFRQCVLPEPLRHEHRGHVSFTLGHDECQRPELSGARDLADREQGLRQRVLLLNGARRISSAVVAVRAVVSPAVHAGRKAGERTHRCSGALAISRRAVAGGR